MTEVEDEEEYDSVDSVEEPAPAPALGTPPHPDSGIESISPPGTGQVSPYSEGPALGLGMATPGDLYLNKGLSNICQSTGSHVSLCHKTTTTTPACLTLLMFRVR